MPKINRSDTFWVGLPEELGTKTIPDAKLQISLNVTAPKGFEKVSQKIITDIMSDAKNTFKKRIKKEIDKKEW